MLRRRRQTADPATAGLRRRALGLAAADAGLEPIGATGVYGAVIDVGQRQGAATLVALADGTTSLYLSTGGGVIGAGEHASVATASRSLLVELARHRSELEPAEDDEALPGEGLVRIHLLHTDGRRSVEVREDLLAAAPTRWAPPSTGSRTS